MNPFFPSYISLLFPTQSGRCSPAHRTPSMATLASEFGVVLPPAKAKQILDPETVSKNYTWTPTPWSTFTWFETHPNAEDSEEKDTVQILKYHML